MAIEWIASDSDQCPDAACVEAKTARLLDGATADAPRLRARAVVVRDESGPWPVDLSTESATGCAGEKPVCEVIPRRSIHGRPGARVRTRSELTPHARLIRQRIGGRLASGRHDEGRARARADVAAGHARSTRGTRAPRPCHLIPQHLHDRIVVFGSAPMVFAGLKPDVTFDLDLFIDDET